jgi:glutamine---fructose-6-phosphate transaminase (isomerizing)
VTSQMAREIAEQPAAIDRTLDALLPRRAELRDLARGARVVLFVARGTSDSAAAYGRYLLEIHAGVGAALAAPSLATHYRVRRDLSDTVVVSLSQSGSTQEIVETQAWAADQGARTVAITNDERSQLATAADLHLPLGAGPELAVPATKTYTAQLAALAVIADALGPSDGRLERLLRRVPGEVSKLLADTDGIGAVVDLLAAADAVLVSGRGLTHGTALELALKLEETNLRPVRGLSYADLRHGPIAVLDRSTAVVLVSAADGPMVGDLTTLAEDVASTGAPSIGIGGVAPFRAACTARLSGPDLPELVAPLGLIVPGQQLAEALARRRGLDPDAPRGLTKVTQTDRSRARPAGERDP